MFVQQLMDFISVLITCSICLAVVCFDSCLVECYKIDDVRSLKEELFKTRRYDATIRPLVNQSQVCKVCIHMSLAGISDIDLNTGKMNTAGTLKLSWTDEQLGWNSSQYGGLTRISVSDGKIWTPGMSQVHELSATLPYSSTFLTSSGFVTWRVAGDLIAMCDLDMHMYPIDKHVCSIVLMASSDDGSELQFASKYDHVGTGGYQPNGKWDLLDAKANDMDIIELETGTPYSAFYCKITIQRNPNFIILHTSVPFILLVLLNMFVYYVPLQGGERITFSVTLFLTLIFFTIDVSDDLPQTAKSVSLISINLIASMIISAFGVISSIVLCKLAEESEESIQPWLRKLTVIILRFKSKTHHGVADTNIAYKATVTNTVNLISEPGLNNIASAATSGSEDQDEKNIDDEKYARERNLTWKIVADSIDYVMFRLCFTLSIALGFVNLVKLGIYM